MEIEYTIDAQDDVTRITSIGVIENADQGLEYIKNLLAKLHQLKARKVLMDNRELDGSRLSFFEKYDLASWITKSREQYPIKWAMVTKPARMTSLKEFETLVRNRGITFLGFDCITEAEEWLCG